MVFEFSAPLVAIVAAPTSVLAAPVKPTTVIDAGSEKFRTAVTDIVGCAVGTMAHQISAVPRCTLARCALVHVRFGALALLFIEFTVVFVPVAGPSAEMNATSNVPAAALNTGLVIVVFCCAALLFRVTKVAIVGAVPCDTTRFTALPRAASVLPPGDWLITLPPGTVVLAWNVTVPTTRPAFVIAVLAAACVCPTTFGTVTGGGPLETTRFTNVPGLTCAAAAGSWAMTIPAGTVVLVWKVIVPSTSPASTIWLTAVPAVFASPTNRPVRTGTAVPSEITRVTWPPAGSVVPAFGFVAATRPMLIVVLFAVRSVGLTVRPAPVIAATAAALVNPTTPGTVWSGCGTGIVTSANCSRSMLSSVSVPSLRFGFPSGGPASTTVTLPFGFRMIEYSASGFMNTAVSQFNGCTAPQSAGTGAGVPMLLMIEMFPGFNRCGSATTS